MKRLILLFVAVAIGSLSMAQPRFSQLHGLYDVPELMVAIEPTDVDATVCYTTDGSTPTAASTKYVQPLVFSTTTLLRAVEVKDDSVCSPVVTATYIFVNSVLCQSNTPEGYPSEWGEDCRRIGESAHFEHRH